jgi:hypothetical protein
MGGQKYIQYCMVILKTYTFFLKQRRLLNLGNIGTTQQLWYVRYNLTLDSCK